MNYWEKRFVDASKKPVVAFGADATGPVPQTATIAAGKPNPKGIPTGWAAIGIMLGTWCGYEIAVKRMTSHRV